MEYFQIDIFVRSWTRFDFAIWYFDSQKIW